MSIVLKEIYFLSEQLLINYIFLQNWRNYYISDFCFFENEIRVISDSASKIISADSPKGGLA